MLWETEATTAPARSSSRNGLPDWKTERGAFIARHLLNTAPKRCVVQDPDPARHSAASISVTCWVWRRRLAGSSPQCREPGHRSRGQRRRLLAHFAAAGTRSGRRAVECRDLRVIGVMPRLSFPARPGIWLHSQRNTRRARIALVSGASRMRRRDVQQARADIEQVGALRQRYRRERDECSRQR